METVETKMVDMKEVAIAKSGIITQIGSTAVTITDKLKNQEF